MLDVKQICNAIASSKLREFGMALQHKSELHIYMYKQLKMEVGLEEYLEYAKEAHARLV